MRKIKELEKRIVEVEAKNDRLVKEINALRGIFRGQCNHKFQGTHKRQVICEFIWRRVYYKHCLICGYEEEVTEAEYRELIKSEEKAALESQIAAAKEQLELLEAK